MLLTIIIAAAASYGLALAVTEYIVPKGAGWKSGFIRGSLATGAAVLLAALVLGVVL